MGTSWYNVIVSCANLSYFQRPHAGKSEIEAFHINVRHLGSQKPLGSAQLGFVVRRPRALRRRRMPVAHRTRRNRCVPSASRAGFDEAASMFALVIKQTAAPTRPPEKRRSSPPGDLERIGPPDGALFEKLARDQLETRVEA